MKFKFICLYLLVVLVFVFLFLGLKLYFFQENFNPSTYLRYSSEPLASQKLLNTAIARYEIVPKIRIDKDLSQTRDWKLFSTEIYSLKYPETWNLLSSGFLSPDPECANCGGGIRGIDTNILFYKKTTANILDLAKNKVDEDYSWYSGEDLAATTIQEFVTDKKLEIVAISPHLCGNICVDEVLIRQINSNKVYLIKMSLPSTVETETILSTLTLR